MIVWLALLACSEPEVAPPPVRPVRTLEVSTTGGALEGVFTGTTRSGDEATLSFRSAGMIEEVAVAAGDRVQPGDLLARLDASDLRLQFQQAQASVAQADANAQLARSSLDRVEQLYVDNNASAADVDGARAQSKGADASLVSAVRQRKLAQRQLDSAELRATRAGRIAQVLSRANENVGAGTPIVVLTPDEALQVTVAVPAPWIERLEAGQAAEVRIPEVGLTLPSTVTEVGGTAQTAGSFPVTVQLEQEDARVRTSMVSEVAFTLPASGESHIELPLSAIGEDGEGRFVWVVDDGTPATVSQRRIQTGELTATGMVVEGVEPGITVVTAGLSKLYEGRQVRVDAL